jgi:FkbM family methyltransferase
MKTAQVISLALVGIAAGAGAWAAFYDTILLVTVIGALGLLACRSDGKAWLVALTLIGCGLAWSRLDVSGCSVWYRGRVVAAKLTGELQDESWKAIGRHVTMTSPCVQLHRPTVIQEREVDGHHYVQFDTKVGPFWNAEGDGRLIGSIVRGIFDTRECETPEVRIRSGDVVVAEGVWNKKDQLRIAHSRHNSAQHSFIRQFDDDVEFTTAPVRPLDDILEELGVKHVEFVKFDIEGAERNALQGASRLLKSSKPQMAIAGYHLVDDPIAIPAAVREISPHYAMYAKKFIEVGPRLAPEYQLYRIED